MPFVTFHVEHIVARQHIDDEQDNAEGLSLSCDRCNAYKGTNLSTIDPQTQTRVDLFNPRQDNWEDHFRLDGANIYGLTAMGRAMVRLLHMNDKRRVELRQEWLAEGGSL